MIVHPLLTDEQANELIRRGQGVLQCDNKTKSVGAIFMGRICTLFNLVNVIIAAMLIFVGSYKNLAFCGVVVFNTAIGIIQELRAKRITDRLLKAKAPTLTVCRYDGHRVLPWDMVAKSDTVKLRPGDVLKADCIVTDGLLQYDESALTGEIDTVSATEGDVIPSGAVVIAGKGTAYICSIGKETRAYSISESAKRVMLKKSVIIDTLNRIIRIISFCLIPVGAVFFAKLYITTGNLQTSVTSVAAAIIGMIPSGLVLLTSTVLAVSVIRLSKNDVLINELSSVEMLARTDVLCLDKTGTITTGKLDVKKIIYFGEHSHIDNLLSTATSLCDNATAKAINEYLSLPSLELLHSEPFDSKRKYTAITVDSGTYYLGAPEMLLSSEQMQNIGANHYMTSNRVVALCDKDKTPLALVLLNEEIRQGAKQIVSQLQKQGVIIKVISGDSASTVSAAAASCGIADAQKICDLSNISQDTNYKALVCDYTVFGRATPEQKKQLVSAYKSKGYNVTMTGDGINDLPAMKEASCSIALSNAVDGAKCAADIALSCNGFDDLSLIIDEGRTVINNICSYATLFLTKTILSLILTAAFLFLPYEYKLLPIQFTLIGALTIGGPAFVLSLIKNKQKPTGDVFANVKHISLPAAIIAAVSSIVLSALNASGGVWAIACATMFAAVLVTAVYPFNVKKTSVTFACIIILAAIICFAGRFFEIYLTQSEYLLTAMTCIAELIVYFAVTSLIKVKSHV